MRYGRPSDRERPTPGLADFETRFRRIEGDLVERVRQRVDALPCPVDHRGQAIKSQSPRRKRLVVLSSEPPIVYVAPRLSPRDRHRLAWGGRS